MQALAVAVSDAAGRAGDMENRSDMYGLGFSSFASVFFSSFCSPSFFGSDLSADFVCFWMASLSCFFFWSTLPVVVVFSSANFFWSRAISAMVDSKLSLSSATPPVMMMGEKSLSFSLPLNCWANYGDEENMLR